MSGEDKKSDVAKEMSLYKFEKFPYWPVTVEDSEDANLGEEVKKAREKDALLLRFVVTEEFCWAKKDKLKELSAKNLTALIKNKQKASFPDKQTRDDWYESLDHAKEYLKSKGIDLDAEMENEEKSKKGKKKEGSSKKSKKDDDKEEYKEEDKEEEEGKEEPEPEQEEEEEQEEETKKEKKPRKKTEKPTKKKVEKEEKPKRGASSKDSSAKKRKRDDKEDKEAEKGNKKRKTRGCK